MANLKKINWNTKKARGMFRAWYKSYDNNLDKGMAWVYCEELCRQYDGRGLVVTAHNCNTFSAAFIYGDPEDEKLVYITPHNDYVFEISHYENGDPVYR